jgi:hypothetical protein
MILPVLTVNSDVDRVCFGKGMVMATSSTINGPLCDWENIKFVKLVIPACRTTRPVLVGGLALLRLPSNPDEDFVSVGDE